MSASRNIKGRLRGRMAILLAVCTTGEAAQSALAQTETQKSTISGVVINSVTRAPVPRALVTTPDNRYATFTDSSGQFEFAIEKETADTSAGPGELTRLSGPGQDRIWINAHKPGFIVEGPNGAAAS